MRSRKFPGLVAAASLVLGLIVGSPITASAGNELNCPGGPIPPGTYDSIDVSGFCLVVGPVTVKHDVHVLRRIVRRNVNESKPNSVSI